MSLPLICPFREKPKQIAGPAPTKTPCIELQKGLEDPRAADTFQPMASLAAMQAAILVPAVKSEVSEQLAVLPMGRTTKTKHSVEPLKKV